MGELITIVGAGIVGICTALSLQERGLRVRLIDKGAPGQETSFGNAGVISPWSVVPQAMPGIWKSIPKLLVDPRGPLSVRTAFWPKMIPWGLRFLRRSDEASVRRISDAMEYLCAPSIDLFRRHLAGTGQDALIADSMYVHAFRDASRARLQDLEYAIRREKGGDLDLIGETDLQSLEPALSREFKAAVLIKGQARAISPGRIGEVLAHKAVQQGADIVSAHISRIERDPSGDWCLHSDSSLFRARKLIVAAGVWSAQLLKPLGIKVPLVAERGYHVQFPNAGAYVSNSIMDVDAKIVASSMEDGMRFAGTAEFGEIDAPQDPRRVELLRSQARAMIPELEVSGMTSWLGRRPSFPDSLPALGAIDGHDGLYAAFGHSHYGLMMAPKSGEVLADIVTNMPSNRDLSAYEPLRF